jgi:GAF domain-containing protein
MLSTAVSQNPVEKDQGRIISGIALALLAVLAFFIFFYRSTTAADQSLLTSASQNPLLNLTLLLFSVMGVATVILVRLRRLKPAAYCLVAMVAFIALGTGWLTGFGRAISPGVLFILIVVSGLVLRERGVLIGLALAVAILSLSIANRPSLDLSAEIVDQSSADWAALLLENIAAALMMMLFLRNTRIDRLYNLTQTTEERLKLSALTSNLSQRISRRAALSQVLNTAVEEIIQTYPFIYHAQIFLVDEKTRDAQLTASTGEVGALLLQRKHKLPVGSRSVIGQVTATGKNIIAVSGTQESVHFRNELLPDTLVEAAFPLRLGDTVIGALDLQSRESGVFEADDIPLFQSLADSIAIAIDNARLFDQTQQRLTENQALVEQMRSAMREVERLNQQLTREAWGRFISGQGGNISLSIDIESGETEQNIPLTPTLHEAIQTCRITQSMDTTGTSVAVPLTIRGLSIGALEFETEEPLQPEDINLIRDVCERLALAVESTRLSDDTRRVALREAILNDLSRRLQTSNNVEHILTETAHGLQNTLGANRVTIRLGAPPRQPTEQSGEKVAAS